MLSDSHPALVYFSRGPKETDLADLERSATLVFDVDPVDPKGPTATFDKADGLYAPLRGIRGVARPGPRIRIWHLERIPGIKHRSPG